MDSPNVIGLFEDLAKNKREQAELLIKEAQMYERYVARIRSEMNKKRPAPADAAPAAPKVQKTTAAAGPSAAVGSPSLASGSKDAIVVTRPAAAENAKPERKIGPGLKYVSDNLGSLLKERPTMKRKDAKKVLMERFKAIDAARKERKKAEKAAAKAAEKSAAKPSAEKKTPAPKKPSTKNDSGSKSESDGDDDNDDDNVNAHQSSDEEGRDEAQVQSDNEEARNEESEPNSGESENEEVA